MNDDSYLEQRKNVNYDEEGKDIMKEYQEFTLDTTKVGQQNIEHKTLSNKEEIQSNDFNKPKNQKNVNSIEPEFNNIRQDFSQSNSPQKEIKKQKITSQPKIFEKIGKNILFDFQNYYKLKSDFFIIQKYLEPFNIKIIENDTINLREVKEKIDISIKKYKEISNNEESLSEVAIILKKINYLNVFKDELEKIEKAFDTKIQNIYFDDEEKSKNPNYDQNKNDNINNNLPNYLSDKILSSITYNQQANKEKKKNFLIKKRKLEENKTEVENPEAKIYKTKAQTFSDNNNIKKLGRLSNKLRNNGVKGIKDGSHPDNGVIKIMRHSLNNICSIFIEILKKIDTDANIFLPGINNKDLKNTTKKQEYLDKTIEDILCVYISIETKKNKIEENKNIINDLLSGDISGKEKEQNLLKKILKMHLKDVCKNFINNKKYFIDGYSFNTFEDDKDFKKYDDFKITKILKQVEDLMNNKIRKREKSNQ